MSISDPEDFRNLSNLVITHIFLMECARLLALHPTQAIQAIQPGGVGVSWLCVSPSLEEVVCSSEEVSSSDEELSL